MHPGQPQISVVIVTDVYETIRRTIHHLKAQTIHDRLEIIIVTPARCTLNLDLIDMESFCRYQIIEVKSAASYLSGSRAAAVRCATAPIVALTESHCYPAPTWAEALLSAHQQQNIVVGPSVLNANPGRVISWASLLIDYGPWVECAHKQEMADLPGNNSAYKTEDLLAYNAQLEEMLEVETVMHQDMQRKGFQLYLDPAAKIYHLNITRISAWLPERIASGRRFAAMRAQEWGVLKRVLYAGGSPLIPFIRIRRVFAEINRIGRKNELLPKILPALASGLFLSAFGEMLGYAFGQGNSLQETSRLELNKIPFLSEEEQQAKDLLPFTNISVTD